MEKNKQREVLSNNDLCQTGPPDMVDHYDVVARDLAAEDTLVGRQT